jgi:hypothetical protein
VVQESEPFPAPFWDRIPLQRTYLRPTLLVIEFARCFNLSDNLQYRLSHADYKFALDVSMPALKLRWLFTQINNTLELL